MPASVVERRARGTAQDLVFTLYGDYLMARERPVWVGSLITLLGTVGVSPESVRTALSRMTRRGWLAVERQGKRGYYGLTRRGRVLLEAGRERIYHPDRAVAWDGTWSIVIFSIPEDRRRLRDRLRVRLLWLGCGMLGNGVWISPRDVRAEVAEFAAQRRVTARVDVFRGAYAGHLDARQLVSRCWDLAAIDARYAAFVRRWRTARCSSPRDAFVRRFRLVHEYRVFPSIDPFLPRPLLPTTWAGEEAALLFERHHEALTEPAERYVDAVCAGTERGLGGIADLAAAV